MKGKPALIPALSPRRGRKAAPRLVDLSIAGAPQFNEPDFSPQRNAFLTLLGERAGVRAGFPLNQFHPPSARSAGGVGGDGRPRDRARRKER